GGDLPGARFGARVDRLRRLGPRCRRGHGSVPYHRSPRQAARPGARHLRRDPGAVHPLRATRPLWPMGEAQGVLLDLSPLQAGHLQAPAGVHAVGAATVTFFRAESLSINFGGVQALEDVSFEVEPGQVFTIIGPNGAGKTTVFNLVSRIYEPTHGRLIFCDEDITRVPPYEIARRGVARTFQNIELFEHATVLPTLRLARHVHAQ